MVRYITGDGANMRIWLNPWHHRGILKEYFPTKLIHNSVCNLIDKVSSLIDNNNWNIPNQVRRHMPEVVDIIEDTKIRGVMTTLYGC